MNLDEHLKNIENEVFKQTNQKLDTYSLAVIRANFLANLPLVNSNRELTNSNRELTKSNREFSEKMKGSIKTNDYGNLDWRSAFMLRWGWTITLTVFLFIVAFILNIYPVLSTREKELVKLEKVENIIKYDSTKNQYFISSADYEFTKNKHQNGIILKIDKAE